MGIFSDRRVYCFCTSFGIAVVFKQATATEKIAYQHRSADQLRFIRSLLDLCYTYAESPVVFIDKFKDKVNIRELKSYDLIDTSDKQFSNLKEDERLLCMLWDHGFSQRELCVIFNLKKVSNLYTKYHRIRKKLENGRSESGSISRTSCERS